MRQVRIPEGEHSMPSQFFAEKPYHRIITPGYKPYREACERAHKVVQNMTNKEKDKGTYDPATFVANVWQKSEVYKETDRLWEIYFREAKEKRGEIVRKDVRDILAA